MEDQKFEVQGHTFVVGKITIQQTTDFCKYVDEYFLHEEFKGKGLGGIIASALEKLPGLMLIIFRGQEGVDKVKWNDLDVDVLAEMRLAFEKKNPTTMELLQSLFRNSGFNPLGQMTELVKSMEPILTSISQQAEGDQKQTTSGKTGASHN